MKNVLMMRSNKAYLPQIDATVQYFNGKNSGLKFFDSAALSDYALEDFDAVWSFPGFERSLKKSIPVIHEYASLSTGIFPQLKNKMKRTLNTKPDMRIFLNQFVQDQMKFTDGITSLQRDMGVDDLFFRYRDGVKQFDCVYIGSISRARGTDRLLQHFKDQQDHRTLLLIGAVPDDLYKQFGGVENIFFTGDVPYQDVPKYASQAVYGINYMPNHYPFNLQTSTKLLEYLAMNLNIITTDYPWVRHFMKQHEMSFITVNEEMDHLEKYLDCSRPQSFNKEVIQSFSWSNVIKNAGIEEKILDLF